MDLNKIYAGNCDELLQKLDKESVDCTVTSPPYNKGNNKGKIQEHVSYCNYIDNLPEHEYQINQRRTLNLIYDATVKGGHCFYNHKLRFHKGRCITPFEWLSKTKWNVRQEIVWNRTLAANIRGWKFWQTDERIYWLYKPKDKKDLGEELKSYHANLTGIWNIMPQSNNGHPAPFPIEIPTRCLYSVFDEETNKTILDPYVGSGTTVTVAKILNHNYIGFDLSQEYVDMTNQRLLNVALNDDDRLSVIAEMSKHNNPSKPRTNKKLNKFFK
jgi:modification methylase